MFKLNQLLEFDNIIIQCHNDPDPDTIGSAFALYRYLIVNDKNVKIIYSGVSGIKKANLLIMATELRIPLQYIPRDADESALAGFTGFDINANTLLITVDCQYGAGNVKKFAADNIAIIDHHSKEVPEPPLCDIRPYLGSCATLVWKMLCEAEFPLKDHLDVSTALYYGLFTDTNSLTEIIHPLDMDIRDNSKFDSGLMKRLRNSNLSIEDLTIAAKTLNNRFLFTDTRSAIFEAEPCDPNILGFAGDLALQVDKIDACVIFCQVSGGVKLSVRSCVRETMANELAARLCRDVGSGGGHKDKAGGYISDEKLNKTGMSAFDFLKERFTQYYSDYDLVYSNNLDLDLNKMKRYRKKAIPIGYVYTTDVFPAGTDIIARTIEGDTHISSDPDIYIMVGICQEIWPIKRKRFEASYIVPEGVYTPDESFWEENHYEPTVKDRIHGESISLGPYIRPCVPCGEAIVYGKKLEKRTKVFTLWNQEGYMFGDIGDYLVVRSDDSGDAYVIEREIFYKTYEAM